MQLWQYFVYVKTVIAVYSAPDDGRKGRPKHVQHTCTC